MFHYCLSEKGNQQYYSNNITTESLLTSFRISASLFATDDTGVMGYAVMGYVVMGYVVMRVVGEVSTTGVVETSAVMGDPVGEGEGS